MSQITQREFVRGVFPDMTGVEHWMLDLPTTRLHVAVAGDPTKPPVILLHGFPQNWWEWREVIAPLAANHWVIAPDLRGAGWSDIPATGYTVDDHAQDIVALMDVLSIPSAALVTHDYGSLIGYHLADSHTGRINQHIAMSAPPPSLTVDSGWVGHLWRSWYQVAMWLPGIGSTAISSGKQRFATHLLEAYSAYPEVWTPQDRDMFLVPLRNPQRAKAMGKVHRQLIHPQARRLLAAGRASAMVKVPTTLLVGEIDPLVGAMVRHGYTDGADPGVTIKVVSDASHYVVDDQSVSVAAIINSTLASTTR
ncbi:alpha/beta fold hydrolase [Jonesia quinghaiensis]|uniref:alpha/beta fold hydrolase n=1 Tax=Jonesia quinghaiensis TaxID=262806 RepID=UPI0003F98EF0|nr:alpha/beta hydrolase [Jonesia quinghaiensis]